MNNRSQDTWETVGVIIADTPTPRHFPTVRISARQERYNDRSLKNVFSYTCGLVDARDDANGATFRPITHIRDANVVAYLELLRRAATMVAEMANKADAERGGKLTGSLGAIAAAKPSNASGKRASR